MVPAEFDSAVANGRSEIGRGLDSHVPPRVWVIRKSLIGDNLKSTRSPTFREVGDRRQSAAGGSVEPLRKLPLLL